MEKEFKFVGFWKRAWMSLIDSIILVIYAVIVYLFDRYILIIDIGSDLQYVYYFIFLLIIPVLIIYLLLKNKSATFGKIICKAIIVDTETGLHLSNKQVIHRMLGYILSNNSFSLGFIHAGFDSRRQTWHDKLAKTVVINSTDTEFYRLKEKTIPIKRDKKFIKVETYFFILFFVLYLVFKFFQYYDEPIKPEAKEWLFENNLVEEDPVKNGFYFLVGVDCLEEDDPFQKGYNWVQNQNKKATNEYEEVEIVFTENWTDEEKAELENKNEKRYEIDDFERIDLSLIQENVIVNDSCNVLSYYVNNQNLIDSLRTSFKFISERYYKLMSYAYYKNTLIPHYKVHTPIFIGLVNMKRLNLAWIGKEYKLGNKQKVIAEFSKEIALSRFLIKQSHFLIGKLVATMMLDFDLHLLSELIDESECKELTNLLPTNLTSSEKDWQEVAISNFNTSISASYMLKDPSYIKAESNGKISEILFKIHLLKRLKLNKSINRTFIEHNFLYHLSQLNAKEFNVQKENYPELEITFCDRIFDPAGSIFAASAIQIYESYIAEFHDIDGYINMLKLKFMIKDNRLESNEIQSFINTHSDSLFNPYTEEAIKWNPEKSILYFEGPYSDDSKLKEMKIKL